MPPAAASGDRVLQAATLLFGILALVLTAAGGVLIGLGLPQAGSGFAPLASGDLGSRAGQVLPLAAAILAAIVGLLISLMAAARWLPKAGGVGLLVLTGTMVEVMAALLVNATAWNAAGMALPGPSLLIAGGMALLAAGLTGALDHD